jgi:hypothetical protein
MSRSAWFSVAFLRGFVSGLKANTVFVATIAERLHSRPAAPAQCDDPAGRHCAAVDLYNLKISPQHKRPIRVDGYCRGWLVVIAALAAKPISGHQTVPLWRN